MEQGPNPYKPPEAPVDLNGDTQALHGLRVLLRILIVVQIALIPLALVLPDTLPPELRQLRDERDAAFFNAHAVFVLLAIALLIVSVLGLWWEKRWAAWLYVVAAVVGYALQLATGVRIASDLAGLVDSFADAATGATLVVLYLGGFFAHAPETRSGPM
jgi:hypothetical protein